MLSQLFTMAILAAPALSNPTPSPNFSQLTPRAGPVSAAAALLTISPASASCSGAPFPDECVTNVQAAPHVIAAFQNYGIYNYNEMAAILSLMAFETGDYKYNKNHYPGRPGQGTRNVQMANFNLMYAKSIPALSDALSKITTASTTTGLSDAQLNAIMALVLPDEYSFGSGPWFYSTQCSDSVKTTVKAGGSAALDAYLGCVNTPSTPDRVKKFGLANTAFGNGA